MVKESAELPAEIINKTEEEIKSKYPEFTIESFGSMELILYKEIEGNCEEHYLLKEKENQIAVYQIDEEGNEKFLQDTGIATDYLPETDRIAIQNGIKIYGKEALNSNLEDYE